jgi:hypothetical protein
MRRLSKSDGVADRCRSSGVAGFGTGGASVVDGHFQMYGDTGFAIGEFFNADDFGDVLAVHGVVPGGIGKSDEDAHARIVGFAARGEIDAFLGGVDADRKILEVLVAGLGRAHADRAGNLRPAAAAEFRDTLFCV